MVNKRRNNVQISGFPKFLLNETRVISSLSGRKIPSRQASFVENLQGTSL